MTIAMLPQVAQLPGLAPPLMVAQSAVPWDWMVLDIETANASPEAADAWMLSAWEPDSIDSWKEETIGKRFKEMRSRKKEQLALMDQSPIICITIRSNTELIALHCMKEHQPAMMHGALVLGFATQRDMLSALTSFTNSRCTPDTVLSGHRVKGFDFPKIRYACAKAEVSLPQILLNPDQPVYDTQEQFGRKFSMNRGDVMVALRVLLDEFGIESHKGLVDGSMIPGLYEQGQWELILYYALLDVVLEAKLFCRMTSRILL